MEQTRPVNFRDYFFDYELGKIFYYLNYENLDVGIYYLCRRAEVFNIMGLEVDEAIRRFYEIYAEMKIN